MNEPLDPFWILIWLGVGIFVAILYAAATLVILRDYWRKSDLYNTFKRGVVVTTIIIFMPDNHEFPFKDIYAFLLAVCLIIVGSLFYGITVLAANLRKDSED